jgi:hypothetical protein
MTPENQLSYNELTLIFDEKTKYPILIQDSLIQNKLELWSILI